MKTVKMSLCAILVCLITVSVGFVPCLASDRIIDWVLFTRIRCYINGIEIGSYNINGNTAVVVEDLAYYGFDVNWDEITKTLSATRNYDKPITGSTVQTVQGGTVGDKALPVYETTITTYFDGVFFDSFNVGGRTIVYVDDLAQKYADDYSWSAFSSILSMTLKEKVIESTDNEEKQFDATKASDAKRLVAVYLLQYGKYEVSKDRSTSYYHKNTKTTYSFGGSEYTYIFYYPDTDLLALLNFYYDEKGELANVLTLYLPAYDIETVNGPIAWAKYTDRSGNTSTFTYETSKPFAPMIYDEETHTFINPDSITKWNFETAVSVSIRLADRLLQEWKLDVTMSDFGYQIIH